MGLTVFNKTKYVNSIRKLEARKAPSYIIDAFNLGFSKVINEYYRNKVLISKGLLAESKVDSFDLDFICTVVSKFKYGFLGEAMSNKNLEFLKSFFVMTNMDILTGNKLPPDVSKMIMQSPVRSLGLEDIMKKLR